MAMCWQRLPAIRWVLWCTLSGSRISRRIGWWLATSSAARWTNSAASSAVALGSRLAERLHIEVGDTVTLIQPQSSCTVLGCLPRSKTYDVVAIFEVGMSAYDGGIIYMPLEAGQVFFQAKDAVSSLVVMVDDPDDAFRIGREIFDATGSRFRIVETQRQYAGYFAWLDVQRNVLALILALIIVVAALNVISGQVLLVRDKTREIAILRTMGATRGAVLRIFLMSGIGIGIVGTLLGVTLAVLFCDNIEAIRQWLQEVAHITLFSPDVYYLKELPARLSVGERGHGRRALVGTLVSRHELRGLAGGAARSSGGAAL